VDYTGDQARNGSPSLAQRLCWALHVPQEARMTFPTFTVSPLLRRGALLLALLVGPGVALAAAPTDGDINRLLSASRAQSMIDTMLPQILQMQQQQIQQFAAQRQLTAAQQDQLRRIQERGASAVRQAVSWQTLRPMYVDLYKKTFTKEEVVAMAEFYESSAGQGLLDKTPGLMQEVMVAMQARMQPLMADLASDIDRIVNETPAD